MAPGAFRMLLAYIVFVNHLFLPGNPDTLCLGPAAVYIFFVLSGFWVYKMWETEYSNTEEPYANFIISRIWRILPVYYFILIITVFSDVEIQGHPIILHYPNNWPALHFYLAHFLIIGTATLPVTADMIPAAWSLDIEMQFYFIAPFLIRMMNSPFMGRVGRVLLYAVAIVGLGGLISYPQREGDGPPPYMFVYLAFFLIGMHAARHDWRPSPRLSMLAVAFATAMVAGCAMNPGTRSVFLGSLAPSPLHRYGVDGCVAVALLSIPYAIATVNSRRDECGPRDRDLANMTYEVYLSHACVILNVIALMERMGRYHVGSIILLSALSVFVVSYLVYVTIDRPLDRLRRQFVRSRRRHPDPMTAVGSGSAEVAGK